jgi:hypothetical protein
MAPKAVARIVMFLAAPKSFHRRFVSGGVGQKDTGYKDHATLSAAP